MKIGAHVSAAGGLAKAIENAKKIGAECIQIFGASPRQWQAKLPSDSEVEKFKKARKESGVGPVFLHAAYLVNLASPDSFIRKSSVENLGKHLLIAEKIGAEGLVFHVGSHLRQGFGGQAGKEALRAEAVSFIVSGIKEVLKKTPGKSWLILENDAGGGGKVGGIKEIGEILKKVKSPRVKVCYDTAHGLEAGVVSEYTLQTVKGLFDEWEKEVGMENIAVLHINDSKTVSGSHHDRHENIGEGVIGISGFKALMAEKRIEDLPWILEVPGFKGEGPDKENIDILKGMKR